MEQDMKAAMSDLEGGKFSEFSQSFRRVLDTAIDNYQPLASRLQEIKKYQLMIQARNPKSE